MTLHYYGILQLALYLLMHSFIFREAETSMCTSIHSECIMCAVLYLAHFQHICAPKRAGIITSVLNPQAVMLASTSWDSWNDKMGTNSVGIHHLVDSCWKQSLVVATAYSRLCKVGTLLSFFYAWIISNFQVCVIIVTILCAGVILAMKNLPFFLSLVLLFFLWTEAQGRCTCPSNRCLQTGAPEGSDLF